MLNLERPHMNERIKELALQVYGSAATAQEIKFAELIIRECINRAHEVGTLRGSNDDMIYGADVAAGRIAKHFGVI